MLHLFALLTGDRYAVLNQHGPASRRKVIAMGSGLLLVTGLWVFTGFTMGINAFGMGARQAIGLGIGMGAVVFMVDRMLLLGMGLRRAMTAVRVSLALLMSILGSIGLDLYIMRAEIGQTMVDVHQQARTAVSDNVKLRYAADHMAAQQEVEKAQAALTAAEQDWRQEMDGSAGTRRYGVGAVARAKESLVHDRRKALAAAQAHVLHLADKVLTEQNERVGALAEAQRTGGLFERIHAMHRYMRSDMAVLIGYLLLTFILVLVELSPLLVKLGFPKTAYERGMELADQLQHDRMETLATTQQRFHAQYAAMPVEEHQARARLQAITDAYRRLN